MNTTLTDKLRARASGICLYGLAPPKRDTPAEQLVGIVEHQLERLKPLAVDGLIVYDIQDEGTRIAEPRPFPFLPTIEPDVYAHENLADLPVQKIVYRCVNRDTHDTFVSWLKAQSADAGARICVLVGAPSKHSQVGLHLNDAYALVREHAPGLLIGGVAIAERHAHGANEHERILGKKDKGCRFFVTQAVYDVTSTKSLLSDYALSLRDRGQEPVPILLTFSPCGSAKTLAFMKWLGIAFPRWLENELRFSADTLQTSLDLCERTFAEIWDYARAKQIPIGVNVESVSIRKVEIEASVELFKRLRARIETGERRKPRFG